MPTQIFMENCERDRDRVTQTDIDRQAERERGRERQKDREPCYSSFGAASGSPTGSTEEEIRSHLR